MSPWLGKKVEKIHPNIKFSKEDQNLMATFKVDNKKPKLK